MRSTKVASSTSRPQQGPARSSDARRKPVTGTPLAPLSAKILSTLRHSEKQRRGPGPEGKERLIGDHEQKRLSSLLPQLDDRERRTLEQALDTLESKVARTLLLRAIGARLSHMIGRKSEKPVQEIARFAARLAKMRDAEMLRRASVIDLDSRRNDSKEDPLDLGTRRGVIRDPRFGDEDGNNDGLTQRFGASCGPSVLQMMLAQADPIYSFSLHQTALGASDTTDVIGDFQKDVLEDFGGIALGQGIAQLRARMRNATGRLRGNGDLTSREADALLEYAERKGPMTKDAHRALVVMRREVDQFPSGVELAQLRRRQLPRVDRGLDFDRFAAALSSLITPRTGVVYEQTTPPQGFRRGQSWRHLDAVQRALERGIDVPFGVCEPGHWMLMTAVDGRKPNRRFLVSDPLGGRTAWVTERDLVRGTFTRAQFSICVGRERGYIDSFYLPKS